MTHGLFSPFQPGPSRGSKLDNPREYITSRVDISLGAPIKFRGHELRKCCMSYSIDVVGPGSLSLETECLSYYETRGPGPLLSVFVQESYH
jgi:hypothetical protein